MQLLIINHIQNVYDDFYFSRWKCNTTSVLSIDEYVKYYLLTSNLMPLGMKHDNKFDTIVFLNDFILTI